MEATQVPISRGVSKDVIYIYKNGILLSHKKNEITNFDSMDEPIGCCAK